MKKDYCTGVCKNSGIAFKFDAEDKERVEAHRWWSQKSGVFSYINGTTVSLSKFLLGIAEKNTKVLKRNGDVYDFRMVKSFLSTQIVLMTFRNMFGISTKTIMLSRRITAVES